MRPSPGTADGFGQRCGVFEPEPGPGNPPAPASPSLTHASPPLLRGRHQVGNTPTSAPPSLTPEPGGW